MFDIRNNFKEFDRFFVGFDPLVKRLSDAAEASIKLAQNYPPYNIKKVDESKYVIELAVAGFAKQDLEIELADGKLIVKGNTHAGEPAEQDSKGEWTWPQFLYHGLAMRPFTRTWDLADNVEIKGGELVNGILKIWLEALTPETKKIKIDIAEPETKGK